MSTAIEWRADYTGMLQSPYRAGKKLPFRVGHFWDGHGTAWECYDMRDPAKLIATYLHTEAAARGLVLDRIAKMDAGDDE